MFFQDYVMQVISFCQCFVCHNYISLLSIEIVTVLASGVSPSLFLCIKNLDMPMWHVSMTL